MTSPPTILLTGGTGKVCHHLAPLLSHSSHPFLIASRSGNTAPQSVKFDWEDAATYTNPFLAAPNITTIFLIARRITNMFPPMKKFIDYAVFDKGVKRLVLLSASSLEEGGPAMGGVHAYVKGLGIEWAVLRPTWFMQNLSEQPQHVVSIRDQNQLFSATGNGKIPWVSCDVIAAVAYRALTDEISHNTDHLILGPELLSYADLATTLTSILHRKITHVELTSEELLSALTKNNVPAGIAEMLVAMDGSIKGGSEERLNDTIKTVTGKEPRRFREFAESAKAVWKPTV